MHRPTARLVSLAAACAPEVGSEAWRKTLREKPKGDWGANEAGDDAQDGSFQ